MHKGALAHGGAVGGNIHGPKLAMGPQLMQAVEWCIASGRCHEPFGRGLSTSMQCKQTRLIQGLKTYSLQMYWAFLLVKFWEQQRKIAELTTILCSCYVPKAFRKKQVQKTLIVAHVSPDAEFILSVIVS